MLKTLPEIISEARKSLKVITAEQAAIEMKETQGLLIDVREVAETTQMPIQKSLNIPRGILEPTMLTKYPDENLAIYLHCASGVRATLAAEQLQRLGYNNVSVISCKADNIQTAFNSAN